MSSQTKLVSFLVIALTIFAGPAIGVPFSWAVAYAPAWAKVTR